MEWFVLMGYLVALAALTALGAPIAAPLFRALPRDGGAATGAPRAVSAASATRYPARTNHSMVVRIRQAS